MNLITAAITTLLLFSAFTLPVQLHASEHQVAVVSASAQDKKRQRNISFLIWGPSKDAKEPRMVAGNSVFKPVRAIPNGGFSQGPHPLAILFHGTSGNYRSMAWIAHSLAAQGMIVIAANHPGSTTMEVTEKSMMETWSQAKDGTFLIDWILNSKEYGHLIDQKNIVSVGFSLGGYSALAIAGATLNLGKLQRFCKDHPKSATCALFGDELYGALAKEKHQEQSLLDERITAVISMAPGFIPAFEATNLSSIATPIMVIAGTLDEMLPVTRHGRLLAGQFQNGVYMELSEATHFSFLGLCTEGAVEILSKEGAEFLCNNPDEGDRQRIHDMTGSSISHFLRQHGILDKSSKSMQ